MKRVLAAAAAVCVGMLAMPAMASADDITACNQVNFGEDVLAKFPNIKEACQKVMEKDGGVYVKFTGEVIAVGKDELTVQIKDRNGKGVSEMVMGFAPDQTINARGVETRFADLKKGDELHFYVERARWGLFSQPGSSSITVKERKAL
jgi:hypothetical protein